jgi:outer membrane protein OmpA-like peptidoglycan-associated protein
MTAFRWGRQALGAMAAALALAATAAAAQDPRVVHPERYIPGIWIDPDGCEHWAMDDGAEGFMSPHRTRDGRPVCHRREICGVMPTDQLFATDSHHIDAHNRARLQHFFQTATAFGFLIYGHTDSRASDEYNLALSMRRANAVAEIASSVGARVVDIMGYGERNPVATNATAEGMQLNRRVEIYCLR